MVIWRVTSNTHDVENSDYLKSDFDRHQQHDGKHNDVKICLSFSAAYGSENLSWKEISAGDITNKNTVIQFKICFNK